MRKIVAALTALGMGAAFALPISGAAQADDSHITITVDDESSSNQSGAQNPHWKIPEGTPITIAIAGCTPGAMSSASVPGSASELSIDLSIVPEVPGSDSTQSGPAPTPSAASTFSATIDIRDDGTTAVRPGNAGTGSFAATAPGVDLGTGNLQVTIPGLAPGTYSVTPALCQGGGNVLRSAPGTIEVYAQPERQATLEVSTQSAAPGQTVTVKGTGFDANELVTFAAPGITPVAVAANDEGIVSAQIAIPATISGSSVTLTATGEKSARSASVEVTLSAASTAPQSGADQEQSAAAEAAQSGSRQASPGSAQSGAQSGAISAQSGTPGAGPQSATDAPLASSDDTDFSGDNELSGEVIRPATSLAKSEEMMSSEQDDLARTGASGLPMLGLTVILLGGVGTAVLLRRAHRH